jgi:REP element-mobilizing transposase RayT
VDDEHNEYGKPFVEPDAQREARAQVSMTQPPFVLSDAAPRDLVRDAIVALCREKGWRLWAVHVRTNHVHVVVSADRDPGRLMSDLRRERQKALNQAGFDDAKRTRWTRRGSTIHLFDQPPADGKIDYTLNRQGARMSWYDGRIKQ